MKALSRFLLLSAVPALMSLGPQQTSGNTLGNNTAGTGSLAAVASDPEPVQLEVDRAFFMEIDIPGFGIVKVKVTTCKQGTSGCP
ncbi:MAG: hypothetical protein HOP15_16850 [Planctomycetes bacterium]|nr:hypothetical protein [Planctomycetota bacterium]